MNKELYSIINFHQKNQTLKNDILSREVCLKYQISEWVFVGDLWVGAHIGINDQLPDGVLHDFA